MKPAPGQESRPPIRPPAGPYANSPKPARPVFGQTGPPPADPGAEARFPLPRRLPPRPAAGARPGAPLRKLGMLVFFIGAAFCAVGIIDFYQVRNEIIMQMETLKPDGSNMPRPRYQWTFFVGIPLLILGYLMRIGAFVISRIYRR